jgi:hypothetical protein
MRIPRVLWQYHRRMGVICALPLPEMLFGANAFEISDIERMNIGAHQPGV